MTGTTRATAFAIVLMAAGLRLWGLDFGLPMAEARPDEITVAFQAMKFGTGDLNPHSFNYPSLFKYAVFVLFGGWYVVGKALGIFAGQEDFLRAFFSGASEFRLLMRLLSATMGTLGVALLLRAPGRQLGAALLAVCFLHVRDSHFGVTDITMVTLATAAVLAALHLEARPGWKAAVLAGALAGLATSTKYNAAVLGLPLLLAAWPGGLRLLAVALAAMGLAFFAGTPFALLDARTFVKDVLYEFSHLDRGQYVDVGGGWVHHATASLRYGMGLPLLGVGLLGVGVALLRDGRRGWILYAFPVVYYLLIGRGETAFFRYALPVVPFLCIAAGSLLDRLGRMRLAGLLALAAPTLYASLQADRLFAAGDTREAMGAWIEAEVPTGSVIVHAGTFTGAPMLQRNVANQTREYEAKQGRADAAGFRKPDDPRWYLADRPAYDVLFVAKPGIEWASQRSLAEIQADPPPWIQLEEYPLTHYASVPDALLAFVAERYELVHEEKAYHGVVHAAFDQQDAFYMPCAGFGAFTRMGPNLRLYRLRP